MAKNIKTKQGFTIIEVVLVLAIAGLIFLMVFIALPALQRSQRDTQRRNDYSMLSTAVTNYISNNNGRLTKLVNDTTSGKELLSKTWINSEGLDPNGRPYYLKAFTYDGWAKNSYWQPQGATDVGSEVYVITGANCNDSDQFGNSVPHKDPAIRAYAVYGYLEGAGTYCQDVGRSTDESSTTDITVNTTHDVVPSNSINKDPNETTTTTTE